jgi:hypothetical protein
MLPRGYGIFSAPGPWPPVPPARLTARDLDWRLVEHAEDLAETTNGFGAAALRAALDSSPLWGADPVWQLNVSKKLRNVVSAASILRRAW